MDTTSHPLLLHGMQHGPHWGRCGGFLSMGGTWYSVLNACSLETPQQSEGGGTLIPILSLSANEESKAHGRGVIGPGSHS